MSDGLPAFYRGRRVLVTGHTGFQGTWLSLWLHELGAKVHGISNDVPSTPSLFEETRLAQLIDSDAKFDVTNPERVAHRLAEVKPELVFHMAAQALVRRSYASPRRTFEVNVMGTANLLDAMRTTPSVKVCQIATSDKCYENLERDSPYREGDPLGGHDPYSSSKACAELVAASFQRSFFHGRDREPIRSVATVRAGNVIGGGDWAEDRIVPDAVRALSANQPIPVRNPSAVRPWQYVLDPLRGMLILASRQWTDPAAYSSPFNLGPAATESLTVEQLVERALNAWGSGSWKLAAPPASTNASTEPHEATMLRLDASKASALLGWRTLHSMDQAVERTMSWYRERSRLAGRFDARSACSAEIQRVAKYGFEPARVVAG